MSNLSKIKNFRFALLTSLIFGLKAIGYAQSIGGFVKVQIDDGKDSDNKAQYFITITYHDSIHPKDDSLICMAWPISNGAIRKVNATSKIRTIDSLTVLNYNFSYQGLIEPIPNTCYFLFLYSDSSHQQDTLELYSRLDIGSGGYYSSVDYLPSIVYHNPAQELSIGFLKEQALYHWPDLPTYNYSWAGNSPSDYGIRILSETGNIVASKNAVKSSFAFDVANSIKSKYLYKYYSSLRAYILVDSTLPGHFIYDSKYRNASGFINVLCETGKDVQFNFDYIDNDADSIIIACYYSSAHFGSSINYVTVRRNDTLTVAINKLITEDIYKQLPQPVNFVIYPYKNQQTKPRYFSFNLVKDFNTGIPAIFDINEGKSQLYPNPSNGIVNINRSENIESIKFINVLGQIVLTISNPENQLHIEGLKNDIYIVELVDDKKNVTYTKLIKE